MEHYWIIEKQNYHMETKYLTSIRPTRWEWDIKDAMRFTDDTVINACKWLILMGESFTVKRFGRV